MYALRGADPDALDALREELSAGVTVSWSWATRPWHRCTCT